jgi:hypothetical protein
MKWLFLVVSLLVASQAEAQALRCKVKQFSVWGAPDSWEPESTITAVAIECRNTSGRPVRLSRHDVHLIDANGDQYQPDRYNDNFDLVFDEDLDPYFVQGFIDFGRGESILLGFTFECSWDRAGDKDLALDIQGHRFKRPEHRRP